ncbi:MAG: hypothetical protein P8Y38_14620, partial [Deltaproteobacteria bacterium]
MQYNLYVRNEGNLAADFTVTDTLPTGTSFNESWVSDGQTEQPITPTPVDSGTYLWDLGELLPGEWRDLHVRLDIEPGTTAGTVLTNCAAVSIPGPEWPFDNHSCAVDTVREPGPNLRVFKDYQWNGQGQLQYDINVQNIGTTTLYGQDVIDSLPETTTFNGNQWYNFWEPITFTDNYTDDQLIWTFSRLEPGWNTNMSFQVELEGDAGVQGPEFGNLVEAPVVDDVYPLDNTDVVTAYAGIDAYVEKWLGSGEPRPGALVTFTVEFGNLNHWPLDGESELPGSHLTETLPTGMAFFTATAPWDPNQSWHPDVIDGDTVVWGWGPLWSDSWWQFDIVAAISDTLEGGDVLVNTIEIGSDDPEGVDIDEGNNTFDLPVAILNPKFEVGKTYESSMVAGTLVTYTLTVTNVGTEAGTGVVLSDAVPANLTYQASDGTMAGDDVVWNLPSVAADGGTAGGWFRGLLPCSGSITNDDYRVVSSDQG